MTDLTSQRWPFIFLSKQAGLQEATTKSSPVFISVCAVGLCPPSECWWRKPKTAKKFSKLHCPHVPVNYNRVWVGLGHGALFLLKQNKTNQAQAWDVSINVHVPACCPAAVWHCQEPQRSLPAPLRQRTDITLPSYVIKEGYGFPSLS